VRQSLLVKLKDQSEFDLSQSGSNFTIQPLRSAQKPGTFPASSKILTAALLPKPSSPFLEIDVATCATADYFHKSS
jgi:hypothetical protein